MSSFTLIELIFVFFLVFIPFRTVPLSFRHTDPPFTQDTPFVHPCRPRASRYLTTDVTLHRNRPPGNSRGRSNTHLFTGQSSLCHLESYLPLNRLSLLETSSIYKPSMTLSNLIVCPRLNPVPVVDTSPSLHILVLVKTVV